MPTPTGVGGEAHPDPSQKHPEREGARVDANPTVGSRQEGPLSPLDRLASMHMQPAPHELQQSYAIVAARETESFQERADALAASQDDGIDSYLAFLLAKRQCIVRKLGEEALRRNEGVLAFEGLEATSVPKDTPVIRYLGVTTEFGRKADLLVVVGREETAESRTVTELSNGIMDVATSLLRERIATFNSLSESERRDAFAREAKGEALPGITDDLLHLVGHRIVSYKESALLGIK